MHVDVGEGTTEPPHGCGGRSHFDSLPVPEPLEWPRSSVYPSGEARKEPQSGRGCGAGWLSPTD